MYVDRGCPKSFRVRAVFLTGEVLSFTFTRSALQLCWIAQTNSRVCWQDQWQVTVA